MEQIAPLRALLADAASKRHHAMQLLEEELRTTRWHTGKGKMAPKAGHKAEIASVVTPKSQIQRKQCEAQRWDAVGPGLSGSLIEEEEEDENNDERTASPSSQGKILETQVHEREEKALGLSGMSASGTSQGTGRGSGANTSEDALTDSQEEDQSTAMLDGAVKAPQWVAFPADVSPMFFPAEATITACKPSLCAVDQTLSCVDAVFAYCVARSSCRGMPDRFSPYRSSTEFLNCPTRNAPTANPYHMISASAAIHQLSLHSGPVQMKNMFALTRSFNELAQL